MKQTKTGLYILQVKNKVAVYTEKEYNEMYQKHWWKYVKNRFFQ